MVRIDADVGVLGSGCRAFGVQRAAGGEAEGSKARLVGTQRRGVERDDVGECGGCYSAWFEGRCGSVEMRPWEQDKAGRALQGTAGRRVAAWRGSQQLCWARQLTAWHAARTKKVGSRQCEKMGGALMRPSTQGGTVTEGSCSGRGNGGAVWSEKNQVRATEVGGIRKKLLPLKSAEEKKLRKLGGTAVPKYVRCGGMHSAGSQGDAGVGRHTGQVDGAWQALLTTI